MNEPKANQDHLLWELGRFVNQFALTENVLFLFLSQLIGLKREESAAVLSGQKTDACISSIKRLFEARNHVIPNQILSSLDQLNTINSFRNSILHNGFNWSGSVSNHVKALPTRVIAFEIKPDDLEKASVDLMGISASLFMYHAPITSENEVELERVQNLLKKPWLYKSAQPKNTHQQNRSNVQKNKRQHESSSE